LGAHAFPPEYKDKKNEYVDLICEKMIPEIANERLADFCDVFCEEGYFDYEMSLKILKTAKEHKLKVRLHADEFVDS
jgi:imidazolonepropionase